MIRKILAPTLIFMSAFVLGGLSYWLMENAEMLKVHKLESPLLLVGGDATQGHPSILPKGTTLYYDQAFPEGFVRYKVYINVEGVNLETHETDEKFWIDPLTAFPMDQDQLRTMLREYPLTKDDLAAVLKNGQLSREEIRELLMEYSD